jgi:hypothetical protein
VFFLLFLMGWMNDTIVIPSGSNEVALVPYWVDLHASGVQLSGKNVLLGMTPEQVEKLVGKPVEVTRGSFHGRLPERLKNDRAKYFTYRYRLDWGDPVEVHFAPNLLGVPRVHSFYPLGYRD